MYYIEFKLYLKESNFKKGKLFKSICYKQEKKYLPPNIVK